MIHLKGNSPSPDQRPYLAGFLAACIAAIASAWLLQAGAMEAQSHALQIPRADMIAVQAIIWLGGGALFGRVFSRAAADPRGGWLFGLSWGYLLWMLGPATTMMWLSHDGPVAKGPAAVSLLAAYILYGLVMGIAFPHTNGLFKPRLGEGVQREFNAAQDFANIVSANAQNIKAPPSERPMPS